MGEQVTFRFCFAVAATMLVLTLVFFLFLGMAAGAGIEGAVFFIIKVMAPTFALLACTGAILYAIDGINHRDDPRHGRRPSEAP